MCPPANKNGNIIIVCTRADTRSAPTHRQIFSAANVYALADLPNPPGTEWIARHWAQARDKTLNDKKVILVLDEIQKVAQWSSEVKTGFEYNAKAFEIFQKECPKARTLLVGEYGVSIEKFLSTPIEEYFN